MQQTPSRSNATYPMTLNALLIYFAVIASIGIGRGSSFLFIHIGLDYAHPMHVITWRLVFAGAAAFVYVLFRYIVFKHRTANAGSLKSYLVPAFILSFTGVIIPFYLTAYGQVSVESGIAGVLTSTLPLMSAVIIAITTKTPVKSLHFLIMGFVGVVLVCINRGLDYVYLTGVFLVLGSALFYAINNVLIGTAQWAHLDKCLLACIMLIISSVISLGVSTWWVEAPLFTTIAMVKVGAAMGLFSTTIPIILMYYAIGQYGVIRGTLGAYLLPVVSLVLGYLFLGEAFVLLQGLGIIIILVAVYGCARGK